MTENNVIKIDVDGLLKARLPLISRFIPRFFVRKLEALVCQDRLNELLEKNRGLTGAEFCRGILKSLEVDVKVLHANRLPDPADRRVIFVSNHPLGGLDGMALIDLISRHYGGCQVWFVVNDLLMAVKPLENVFLPINKFGSQSRESARRIDDAFEGGDPLIIFPAGLVSRLQHNVEGNCDVVADLSWRKMFVQKSIQFKRDIVPLYFSGRNSMDFYRKARMRKRSGLKFNLEMILLPREMFAGCGKTYSVVVGERHRWESLKEHKPDEVARQLRSEVYNLSRELDADQ